MAKIAVIDEASTSVGGGKSVFIHTVAALQNAHDVITVTATPWDIKVANEYFGTNLGNVRQKRPTIPYVDWDRTYDILRNYTSGQFGVFDTLRFSLFQRAAVRSCNDADIFVHTQMGSAYGSPSIQYIHNPSHLQFPGKTGDTPDNKLLERIERLISPITSPVDFPSESMLLANSDYIVDECERVYGVQPDVVPPPVNTANLPNEAPVNSREAAIMVGRISSRKAQHLGIEIIEQVRNMGHDINLTIVGGSHDDEYTAKIKSHIADLEWASYLGRVPRDELVDQLTTHRYGLHTCRLEHFGIAVAEMVAAGCLPLVPNDGGQVEIVNNLPSLVWETPEEAAQKLSTLQSDASKRKQLVADLPDIEDQYGVKRFQAEILRRIEQYL
jgi:glycosyltransferase involved in cell wall biosynthesis